jgi:hypothetical protein
MAESKAAKLQRFKNKKTALQIQLAELAVKEQTHGMTNDGTLYDFFARRNPKISKHRDKLGAQIRNLKKDIEMYDRKISALQ